MFLHAKGKSGAVVVMIVTDFQFLSYVEAAYSYMLEELLQ